MSEHPLTLLQVHAHPDDEASKGAGTTARHIAEGGRAILVTCTGGEAGDILNSAVDTPENRENLFKVRMAELADSVAIIGYDELYLLGYHDSGMPDTEVNHRPDNFANAPLDEAVERLVRIIRTERPHVVVSYLEDRDFYGHPDHIRVFEICGPAFDAAGDPEQFPEAGEPWQPSKLYLTGFSRPRIEAMHAGFQEVGIESPFGEWLDKIPVDHVDNFGTRIDIGDWLHIRRASLLAHRTQVEPDSFWMQLPDEVLRRVWPWEEYVLDRSLVETGVADGEIETDLFAGLRS